MESLQQTAFSTGQQPNVLLFNWQQVVASGQTALLLGHWLLSAQTRITEQLISDNTLMCHFICPKKLKIYILLLIIRTKTIMIIISYNNRPLLPQLFNLDVLFSLVLLLRARGRRFSPATMSMTLLLNGKTGNRKFVACLMACIFPTQ